MADTFRSKLASLPFAEKIKILEQLRERELLIALVREKLKARTQPEFSKRKSRQPLATSHSYTEYWQLVTGYGLYE